jgi:hypothetical protein
MSRQVVLVDAHVHVYPGADVPGLLSAAARNFRAAAEGVGAAGWHGVLLLTEVATANWFESVASPARTTSAGPWTMTWSPEDPAALKVSDDQTTMTVVAGRQIVTAERLEVHAFGTRAEFPEGRSAQDTLQAVQDAGAIAALPWGVGKWLGERGRLVERLLTTATARRVFAADNAGRPSFWHERRLSLRVDQPVFRGSDPLPLVAEEYRVGKFGSWMEGSLAPHETATLFLGRLSRLPPSQLRPYGRPASIAQFLRNQTMLRLQKHGLAGGPV